MPCYEVRTVSVEFKAANIDLLKRAIKKEGHRIEWEDSELVSFTTKTGKFCLIDLKNSAIKSDDMDERGIASFANSLKRAYSAVVLDEVAKKQKWMKKDLGQNRYQLQRF